jgi:hypothetical protein
MSSATSSGVDTGQGITSYLSLLPPADYETLKRCSLLGRFDAELFGELTADVPDAPSLEELRRYPFVTEVRRREGWFRLRDDARRALSDAWWQGRSPDSVPPALTDLTQRLIERLRAGSVVDPDELIRLAMFADPEVALSRWVELYKSADAQFDLARCRALLGILAPMVPVSANVAQTFDEHQAYLDARELWTAEWYQSMTFLVPEASHDTFQALLDGASGRMLELRGMGGYGKTSHLEWLIARRCVPARIPCARIDFDVVDELTATREPWLVLLEMADQLGRQLPGGGFGRLVASYTGDRTRLYRRSRPTRIEARDLANVGQIGADEIPRRFLARLKEIPADRPVVIVLDTLEVPLHLASTRSGPAMKALLEMVGKVQRDAPCVRVVLSGRYRIEDVIPELRELFAPSLPALELPKLTAEQCSRYLVDKRRVTRNDQVEAAVTASEGIAFSLALLGDLIRQQPEISPQTILDSRGAEYAWLVRRVVKRIPEQSVRWVLRYAAIPRRFDEEIVREVLWPRIQAERAGVGGLDDPDGDELDSDPETLWEVGPAQASDEDDGATVWPKICRYASGSSWISYDSADAQALKLQPEVVRPLRALLSGEDKRIVPALHADAVAHFVNRAAIERDRDHRCELLREAVFHRFQLEGKAAGEWWEKLIRAADGPDVRYALSGELARGREYVDRDGKPQTRNGEALVAQETLQAARLELCLAGAELATIGLPPEIQARLTESQRRETLNERHTLWQTAAESLDAIEQQADTSLPSGRFALARALVAIGTRGLHQADPEDLREALEGPGPTPRERLWAAVLKADWLEANGATEEVEDWLIRARDLAAHAPAERELVRRLTVIEVGHHRRRGAYDSALRVCDDAAARGLADAELRLLQATLRLELGDATGCLEAAIQVAEESRALAPQAHMVIVLANQQRGQFSVAVESADRAIRAIGDDPAGSALAAWVRGLALMRIGESLGALLRAGEARSAFAEAARVFGEIGAGAGACAAHIGEASLLMRRLGHFAGAGVALDHATRAAGSTGDGERYALALRAELADRCRHRAEAERIVERLKRDHVPGAQTEALAMIAVTALAHGSPRDRSKHAKMLADTLAPVTPASARLPLLAGIERCPNLKPSSAHAGRLRDVVVPAEGWIKCLSHLQPLDRAPLLIRAASFARVVGNTDREELLAAALRDLGSELETLVALREVLRVGRTIEAREVLADARPAALALALRDAHERPMLSAATIIDYLETTREMGFAIEAGEMEALCVRVAGLLADDPSDADGLRARLAELDARVPGRDAQTATSHLQTAVRLYAAVGNTDGAERLATELGPDSLTGGPWDNTVTVDLSMDSESIDGGAGGNRLRRWLRRASPSSRSVRAVVAEWQRSGGLQPYPPDLPDLIVSEPEAFRRALGQILDGGRVLRRTGGDRRLDLAIQIHDGALQALPWELAADGSNRELTAAFRRIYRPSNRGSRDVRGVRVVQSALNRLGANLDVDGVSGPDTARAMSHLESAERHSAPRTEGPVDDPDTVQRLHLELLGGALPGVIVVRPALAGDRRRSESLERRYRLAGLEPSVVHAPQAADLAALLDREPPPVIIHFLGGIVATGGATAVDLRGAGEDWPGEEAALLTAADLDLVLRAVRRNWPAPVVVLDVPRLTGLRETLDQLLLRNCFAGDLFALGGARAVLATGLTRSRGKLQDVLVEGLGRGDPIADVTQSIRRNSLSRAEQRSEEAIAGAAAAVWTNDPGLRLPVLPKP